MKKDVTQEQADILKELINIGVGKGAEVLNTMLSSHITLDVPSIAIIPVEELEGNIGVEPESRLSAVQMRYQGNFSGDIELIFPIDAAGKLVSIITGDFPEHQDMDQLRTSTLQEIGNVVLNAVIGTISNIFSFQLTYSLPTYIEGDVKRILAGISSFEQKVLIFAKTTFKVQELEVTGNLAIFFSVVDFEELIRHIDGAADTFYSD